VTVNVCTCEMQLCCELTVLNQFHQLCSSLQLVWNLLFRVHLYYSCVNLVWFSLCIFPVFLSFLLYSYSHSHYTLFLPTITCSLPEVLIKNNRTTKCCPVLSQINPVPFDCLKAQCHLSEHPKPMHLAHAVYCWIRMSYRFGQISRSRRLDAIFNINCAFVFKNFEIPVIKCTVRSKCVIGINV
jgi:hypothetical protein